VKRSWNPALWFGFLLALVSIPSYPLFFARFPSTRDVPWANWLIIALALVFIAIGVARAFRQPDRYRGKIVGSIFGVLVVGIAVFFAFGIPYLARQIPASHGAPRVGELAPDFTLPDSKNNAVTLSALVDSPFAPNGSSTAASGAEKTAGTVLIFYRGYW
jgi:hypothetical protein